MLWMPVVGEHVERAGFAHAFTLVIDDQSARRLAAFEAHLDGAVWQMAGRLEAQGFIGEGVVGPHLAILLDEEHFVVDRWYD